jgi:ribonuclease-3
MAAIDFSTFEKKCDITFKDKALLKQAFIHRSYINENRQMNLGHNERLEFLGDAVLELVVTDFLYRKYRDRTEGDLTAYRSALVNAQSLSKVAIDLSMNDYLLLSKGEAKDTGRARAIILADTMEAVIGAVYLDQGYDAAKKFIESSLFRVIDIEDIIRNKLWLDPKSRFQERAQEKTGLTPLYKTIKEIGPDHDKTFTVGVYLGEKLVGTGMGPSKQEAEQEAALAGVEAKDW